MNEFNDHINGYRNILKETLLMIADVPDDQINEFVSHFSIKKYPKKSVIIAPNNTNLKGFFIINGLVRMSYIKNKKEITSDFREPYSFFLNGYTQFTGLPNFDTFTAFEDTVCLEIQWTDLEQLLSKYHALEHLGRRVVEMHYSESERVSHNLLFLSVEERYDIFFKERGSLLNRVSFRHV